MAIDRYDPLKAPDAAEWVALDEAERLELVIDYHKRARVDLPNLPVHASMHVAVENQVALGDETPVREKVRQLVAQGLNRHDAIHAVASVLIKLPLRGDDWRSVRGRAEPAVLFRPEAAQREAVVALGVKQRSAHPVASVVVRYSAASGTE